MTEADITDEMIEAHIARGKAYFVSFFKLGPRERNDKVLLDELQMKHLKHMYAARQNGKLAVNGPFRHGGDLRGLSIWTAPPEEVEAILASDPMVQAGFFRYEIYPWFGIAGESLP